MNSQDRYQPVPFVKIAHPEWSKNATLYQLNTRQLTQEKVFAVFNFSSEPQEVTFKETLYYGRYTEYSVRLRLNYKLLPN